MTLEKVSKSVYCDTSGDGNGNFGGIVLPSSIVAIDSSMFPSVAQTFRKQIEKTIGKNARTLILTHYHADHVFGNQVYRDCTIISSRRLKEKMLEESKTDWTSEGIKRYGEGAPEIGDKLRGIEITYPTKPIESSFALIEGSCKIEIKHTGGHTADSSYVYFPSEKILFSGDLIFSQRFPWGADPTVDPEKWLKTLRLLTELKVDLIVPGHGPVCDSREVLRHIDFFEKAMRIIKDIVSEGGSEQDVAESRDYPEFYPPKRPEGRKMTLFAWYQYFKRRL